MPIDGQSAHSIHCCVQIIVDNDQARVKDGLPVEAHITAGLNHQNVVRTIAHAWRPLVSHMSASMSVWDSAGSNSPGPFACKEGETWLLLELCDKGTLQVCSCPLKSHYHRMIICSAKHAFAVRAAAVL